MSQRVLMQLTILDLLIPIQILRDWVRSDFAWASEAGFMTPTPTPSHPSSPVVVPPARNKPHRRALHRHSTRRPDHRRRRHTQSSALHLLSTHTLRGVRRLVCPSGLRRSA